MLNSKKLFLFSFLLATVIAFNASLTHASEQLLATISTDATGNTYHFSVSTEDEQQSLQKFLVDNFYENVKTSNDTIPIETFIKEGIKLSGKSSKNFAKIIGENFDSNLGGVIVIDILNNAITGKRVLYELQLAKAFEGWKLFYQGIAISKIKVRTNRLPIVGVVGAKDLELN
jgi:hypothetical protein